MLKTVSALFRIRTVSAVNRFLHYTGKLPVIGRFASRGIGRSGGIKNFLGVFVWIFAVLFAFINKFMFLGLAAVLPAQWSRPGVPGEQLALVMHVFLLLSFLAAGVTYAAVLEPKKEKYIAVKLMRMPPGAYMRATLAYRYLLYLVSYIPALAVLLGSLGLPAGSALPLAVSVTAWRVLCEYAHLKLFEKAGIVLIRKIAFVWLTIAVCFAAAYAPFLLDSLPVPTAGLLLLEWPAAAVIAAAGLFAAVRLAKYPDYRAAVDAASKRDDPLLDFGKAMEEAQKQSVRVKKSDYAGASPKQTARAASKRGYAYLHALFFARHRRLIRLPLARRIAIVCGAGAAVAAAVLAGEERLASFIAERAASASRYLVFPIFLLSLGDQMCRALFYHCDIHLLRYAFFRRDALKHFRYRLLRLAGYQLAIGAALAAMVTLVLVLAADGAMDGKLIAQLWLNALLTAVFFAVHQLAMYYLFQPYSTEVNAKNPYYHMISLVVSYACGVTFFAPIPPAALTLALGVLTPAYLLAACILVGRFAGRTFRVK